jgi:hypothetical protein
MAINISKNIGKWAADNSLGAALWVLLFVTILPFLILSFYNHPSLDDYAFTGVELQKGFFGAQKYWYFTWTGRYFSTVLLSLNPLVFNMYWGYKFNTAIQLLLLIFATYWLCGKVFKNLDKSGKTEITALFIFSYLILLPKVSPGLYWQTTSYQYLTTGILTFCLLGCLISYYSSEVKKWYFILSCLLVIAIIGCHEISMVFIDLLVFVITISGILKKRTLIFPITLLILCILFSFFEIIAPGNTKRGLLMYHDSHILKYSIRQSFLFGKDLIVQWFPFMFFMGFLLFNLLSKKVDWRENAKSFLAIPLWFSFMACMSIPVIGLFIVYWSMGWIPTRVVDIIYFYFIVGMMYFLICSIAHIKIRYPMLEVPAFIKIGMIFAFIVITYFYKNGYKTNNIVVAYSDLISGTASAYNKERAEENEYLVSFKGDSCMINSIKNFPQSLFIINLPQPAEPGDSLGKLINYSFYQYYHKKYIGIK